jgi:hypothetical protein
MELLIVIRDAPCDDPVHNFQAPKAGDVIAYHQDGQDWGLDEVNNPDWRIIHVPGLSEVRAQALVERDISLPGEPSRMRQFALDVGKLDSHDASLLKPRKVRSHTRGNNIDAVIDPGFFVDAHALKPPASLQPRRQIGGHGNVIG